MPETLVSGSPDLVAALNYLSTSSSIFREGLVSAYKWGFTSVRISWVDSKTSIKPAASYGKGTVWNIEINRDRVAIMNGSRIISVEEQIAHELGHGAFNPRSGLAGFVLGSSEKRVVAFTDDVRRQLALPVRGEDGTLSISDAIYYNDFDNPTELRGQYFLHKNELHLGDLQKPDRPTPPKREWVNQECFTAGTPITMSDGTTKSIEQIEIGDEVMAFDTGEQGGLGPLRAGRVSRTFVNHGKEVIDFHGMKVTPGHKFLSGNGRFHLVEEILDMDGSIIQQDGIEIRARTGQPVGSPEDRVIPVGYQGEAGEDRIVYMRAGTPCAHRDDEPGKVYSILGMMTAMGYQLQPDGKFTNGAGPAITAFWHWGVPDEQHIVITGDDRARMVDEASFRASADASPAIPSLNRKQRRGLNAGKKRSVADVSWKQNEAPTQYGIFCDGVQ